MRIIETDNRGGDYPNESFLLGGLTTDRERAQRIADAVNDAFSGERASRFWRIVEDDYVLQPGFEP